jgi:hypothetical protein
MNNFLLGIQKLAFGIRQFYLVTCGTLAIAPMPKEVKINII